MMKQLILVFAGIFLITLAQAQQKAQQFAIKSGYVEYKLTGNTTGIKSIWWDDYGEDICTEINSISVTKMFGIKNETKTHTISLVKKNQFWTTNLIEHSGQKGILPNYQHMLGMDQMTEEEQKQMGRKILESLGGEIIGKENILASECEVVKLMGAKAWVYKGVTLKSEAKLLGMVNKEIATKFEKNITISASRFTPVKGIDYQSVSNQQYKMNTNDNDVQNFLGMEQEVDLDQEEVVLYPVDYPYSKFKEAIDKFDDKAYRKLFMRKEEGSYYAMFMKGMSSHLTIAAISMKNGNPSKYADLESFTCNGKQCFYGKFEDDESTISSIVELPQFNTYIVIGCSPELDKNEVVRIIEQLEF